MPYRGNFRNKGLRPKTQDYMNDPTYKQGGHEPANDKIEVGLVMQSLRNSPKSAYSIQADPYTAANSPSQPYALYNIYNKRIGGVYAGNDNLDGGNVQQYANSTRSKFLKAFDFMKLDCQVNYRFRPMKLTNVPTTLGPDDPYVGSGLIDQCRQAIAEATSVLAATTFTNMAINNYVVETDLPMGSAVRVAKTYNGRTLYVYDNLTDVIYATTTYYQLVLQEVLHTINWHNSFRLKMGTMIRSSWNRETPNLNTLFGLFKKKSFLSLIDSLCLSLPGEYIDTGWAQQVNALTLTPSRKSNSMNDPVLELSARHTMPTVFRMYYVDNSNNIVDAVFDASTDFTKTITFGASSNQYTFAQANAELAQRLSAYNAMKWARESGGNTADANAYFNNTKKYFDVINLCLTTFKTKFNDVREVLDVVSRTGVVTWQKGFRPSITKDTDAALFCNALVEDMYHTVISGDTSLRFNNITKRWETFTLWNEHTGIPAYCSKSGGAFLMLSAKNIDLSNDTDQTYQYLPIMAYYSGVGTLPAGSVTIKALSRDGVEQNILSLAVALGAHNDLLRLAPLDSQESLQLRVPYIEASEASAAHKCFLLKTLLRLFGVVAHGSTTSSVIEVAPDILAIYNIELQDITNDSIAYARATGPFRGSEGYDGSLGFQNFGQA